MVRARLRRSGRSVKSHVAGSDDEVVTVMDPEVVLVDSEQVGDSLMVQQNLNVEEIPSPQDVRVSLDFVVGSEIVLMCDFQEDQENTPPPPIPSKSKYNSTATQSSVSRKTVVPCSTSSPSPFHHNHSLASEENPTSMAGIIGRANSAAGTPSEIKSYPSFTFCA
jgi:hypothetical protein